jgi:uncharacterized alkaline shock family protein YloU
MEGTITIDDRVIAHIAARAAEEVDGVHSIGAPSFTRSMAQALGGSRPGAYGVGVQAGKMEAAFNMSIVVDYGRHIPDVAHRVQRQVAERVAQLCGLNVTRVNVHVNDLKQSQTRQIAQIQ